jgi:hypothetical protein
MSTTFDTESEAQAAAAELNNAAERDVRYRAQRYREKWAIARQVKRTYWGWDGYPDQLNAPKSAPIKNDVETVRQIVNLALSDGVEMVVLMTLLRERKQERHQ